MTALPSWIGNRWISSTEAGVPLKDATTGSVVAHVSTHGIDLGEALTYARHEGVASLAALSYRERAGILKDLSDRLGQWRDELFELSAQAGSTRKDAEFDVDGGGYVMASYARTGLRELPLQAPTQEGGYLRLSRKGTFVGTHILSAHRGIALQINAFNFPVWGPLEKFAGAFLAGSPTIVKPATPASFITHRLMELIDESALLPPGSLQLLCGPIPGVLESLGAQDTVFFTGSQSTALALKSTPGLSRNGTRFNAETDSLNAALLGPDGTPNSKVFDLLINEVANEMTIKAGQRCTSIRRVLVPNSVVKEVAAALSSRLGLAVLGDPRDPKTNIGPLVSVAQRDSVTLAVAEIARECEIVHQGPTVMEGQGAFFSPTIMVAPPSAEAPHHVEAFGPVTTIIGYQSPKEAFALAHRGGGSLVASIITDDPEFATLAVKDLAPSHGRLLILDSNCAAESTGHGSPLPTLIHGGPGRAGGGEELGGHRSIAHNQQRTALQGSPEILTRVTARWAPGANRVSSDTHPFRKTLGELALGDSVTKGPHKITSEEIAQFAAFTGDTFYAHTNPEAAKHNPIFGGIVAHGYLVIALAAGLFVDPEPGPVLANYGIDNLRFRTPVHPGDEITVTLTCAQITPRTDIYGEVRWDTLVTTQDDQIAASYDVLTMVATHWPLEET